MPPLICLAGPTASGKSGVALALAARFPIEIVSVDSAQVYRSMDIGTAKPSAEERRRVAHHLIDLIDPSERYSAARFCSDAREVIAAIRARGRIPLLVGGTMLYLKALREGLDDLPQASALVRAELEAQAQTKGWPALHRWLAEVDPATAARLAPTDAQRIQRALEVWQVSGRPLSSFFTEPAARQARDERFLTIALEPSERSVLHTRIQRRFEAMLAAGFVEEVRALHARGDLHAGLPALRCVGYRQIWQVIEGLEPPDTLVATATAATRQLAKRQLTWLRSLPERHTLDCLAPDLVPRIEQLVSRALEGG
jgi:tRNA dimethylallyltransferase